MTDSQGAGGPSAQSDQPKAAEPDPTDGAPAEPLQAWPSTMSLSLLGLSTMSVRIGERTPAKQTIGIAVEVPEPHAATLQSWRAAFGDPLADLIPAHITLLPPTKIEAGWMASVEEHLQQVVAQTTPFTIRLQGTDTFRPVSPVVYVCLTEGVQGCDDLQRRIRTGPLVRDLSFPYHPHVTVAHELDEPALDRAQNTLADYEAHFPVTSVGLYEQDDTGRWNYRRRFGFGAASLEIAAG